MRRLVIIQHRGHEFANCLWSDMSISAYGLSVGARVWNVTSLEHTRFGRIPHLLLARGLDILTRKTCGMWALGAPKYLPPTVALPEKLQTCTTLFFSGWLFRNPVGFERYRKTLLAAFSPTKHIQRNIARVLASQGGNRIYIGLHIKQLPFKGFENGEFLISPERIREITDEYVREKNIPQKEVTLVIVSDKDIQPVAFDGYITTVSDKDTETNFFLLSKCSVILGTNSTFSNLAAWFGNIPHIVTTDEPIDWKYYQNKTTYFENKYATFTYGQ